MTGKNKEISKETGAFLTLVFLSGFIFAVGIIHLIGELIDQKEAMQQLCQKIYPGSLEAGHTIIGNGELKCARDFGHGYETKIFRFVYDDGQYKTTEEYK